MEGIGPAPRVVEAVARLSCKAAVIDGEIIVQDGNGISDFHALRSAIHEAPNRIVFFAFYLLGETQRDTAPAGNGFNCWKRCSAEGAWRHL